MVAKHGLAMPVMSKYFLPSNGVFRGPDIKPRSFVRSDSSINSNSISHPCLLYYEVRYKLAKDKPLYLFHYMRLFQLINKRFGILHNHLRKMQVDNKLTCRVLTLALFMASSRGSLLPSKVITSKGFAIIKPS